jgi:hypothetical protein
MRVAKVARPTSYLKPVSIEYKVVVLPREEAQDQNRLAPIRALAVVS